MNLQIEIKIKERSRNEKKKPTPLLITCGPAFYTARIRLGIVLNKFRMTSNSIIYLMEEI